MIASYAHVRVTLELLINASVEITPPYINLRAHMAIPLLHLL